MIALAILIALFAAAVCAFAGLWAGLALAAERALRAECDRLAAVARGRLARPPLGQDPPPPAAGPGQLAGPLRVPGYTGPFPSAARYAAGPALAIWPHGGAPSPASSPVELDPAVRPACNDTALYGPAEAARTRHAERNYLW